uniref:Uncharacterized protein n=1 Tax=Clandestinovirus TaxID=2831644 RepID=A0A8F8PN40_9VIRU|nr:hypothetical protein KOM_12_188 [Clandestinovirus]
MSQNEEFARHVQNAKQVRFHELLQSSPNAQIADYRLVVLDFTSTSNGVLVILVPVQDGINHVREIAHKEFSSSCSDRVKLAGFALFTQDFDPIDEDSKKELQDGDIFQVSDIFTITKKLVENTDVVKTKKTELLLRIVGQEVQLAGNEIDEFQMFFVWFESDKTILPVLFKPDLQGSILYELAAKHCTSNFVINHEDGTLVTRDSVINMTDGSFVYVMTNE